MSDSPMRIVHLGTGAFHRAHQAWHIARANAATGSDWRIDGVSLRAPDTRDALAKDDYRYALEIADADGRRIEVIDLIDSVIVAPEALGAVADLIARPETKLVTLTVTEKAYGLRADGQPDPTDLAPEAEALRAGQNFRTMPGHLLTGLIHRDTPLTVMSCDNLPGNGAALRAVLLHLANAAGLPPETVTRHAFPSTMVDRITPRADTALRDRMRAAGVPAVAPVATEAFSEWVIEDNFAGPVPDFAAGGAQVVPDVAPYELRKLRMLNGAHSTLAYAGLNKGHTHVHDAIADPELRILAQAVMDEAAETLPREVRADAPAYARALIQRFENPHLAHRLDQIAMDGSLKLPIRILATMEARASEGSGSEDRSPACARALREWERWLDGEAGAGRSPDDPAAGRLLAGRERGEDARTLLEAAP